MLRNASAREVLTAIRAVSQGQSVCPPTLCAALFEIAARPQSPGPTMHASPISVPATSVPAFRLPVTGVAMTGVPMNLLSTPRQPELVSLIAQGLTNHEIAARLNLAAQTIENHIHRMSGKVGTEERAKVVEITRVRNAVRWIARSRNREFTESRNRQNRKITRLPQRRPWPSGDLCASLALHSNSQRLRSIGVMGKFCRPGAGRRNGQRTRRRNRHTALRDCPALSGSCPAIAARVPGRYPMLMRIGRKCCSGVVQVLLKCCSSVVQVLSGCLFGYCSGVVPRISLRHGGYSHTHFACARRWRKVAR